MTTGKAFVAVAGNIGSGKSSLTRLLSEANGWTPMFESVEDNPYLGDFYADMKRWSFNLQVYFLSNRFRSHKAIAEGPDSVILDRVIYEDAEIFARNLHLQRLIDRRDFAVYWELYRTMSTALRPPDLLIQLRCPVRTLRQRIRGRGREMEQDIPPNYLRRLNRLYEDWFAQYDLSPVLVLETDKLDWMTDLVDRVDLFRKIERHL